jgi:hypothetical protein
MLYRASQDSANAFSNSRSRAFQELPAGLDTGDRSIELLFDREMLCLEVEQRHIHRGVIVCPADHLGAGCTGV